MVKKLVERVQGQLCVIGMNPDNEADKILEIVRRYEEYQNLGLDPDEAKEIVKQNQKLRKAFALACRVLEDCNFICPPIDNSEESEGWGNWQKYFLKRASSEQVCHVCGCTWDNACPGGCCWVKEDLCSRCKEEAFYHTLEERILMSANDESFSSYGKD